MPRLTLDDWIKSKVTGNPIPVSDRTGGSFAASNLSEWQLDRLNETLSHACKNSAFYRERFGFAQLSSLGDLASLPFTTPADLTEDPYRLLCVPQDEISRIVTLRTSGSTGPAKRVFFTDDDLFLCVDFFSFGMQNLVSSKDKVGILFPHETPASVGDQLQKGLGRAGIPSATLFGNSSETILETVHDKGITSLAGMPLQMEALLDLFDTGKPDHTFPVTTVLVSADYVSPALRQHLRQSWGVEVFEHYGMTEMGLGCGVSCEFQRGYHVREADLYLEIIDPATGEVLPDGEWGEIVFTTLTRRGMPFIRYRTGDISRWRKDPCPCGSGLRLLDYICDRGIEKGSGNR